MNKTLRLAALLAAVSATSAARAAAPPSGAMALLSKPAPADPCRRVEELAEPAECGGSALCSPRTRVRIACELRDAMESRYVFEPVKGRLLAAAGRPGFDPRRHLDQCVVAERAVLQEDEPLRFYDRMRRCVSSFEDGHLMLSIPDGPPPVALGLRLRVTGDGAVYVAHRDARLLATEPGGALLSVGTRVLAIDGRPVGEALAELAGLVPGSSEAARRERAVDALTRRAFSYPTGGTATLTIADGAGTRDVVLPWWIAPGGDTHPLTKGLVRRAGLRTTDLVDWRGEGWGEWLREGGDADGLVRGDTILPLAEAARLQAYRGDGGQLAARLGVPTPEGGRAFCYAQVLTFQTETLAAQGGAARPLPEVLGDFFRRCDERHLDLVLDLRQNEGGYISHSGAVAALLGAGPAGAPGGALLVRATQQTEGVYLERSPGARGDGGARSDPERILEAIRKALQDHHDYTPAFVDAPAADEDAFSGRVVALTSPSCMSACDRLAALLKAAGRATLVGGPTEGAGGSQQETKDLSVRWTDTSHHLTVSIPNAAMGVQPASAAARQPSPDEFFASLAFENRPVQPDVGYAVSLDDLTGHGRGWLAKTLAALASAPARTAPAQPVAAADRT